MAMSQAAQVARHAEGSAPTVAVDERSEPITWSVWGCWPTCRLVSGVFRWVAADTFAGRGPLGPSIYDCVRLVVVRDGSVILAGDVDARPVSVGEVALVAPGARFGFDPEGRAAVTTVLLDTDYLIDMFFWQHLDLIADRAAARDLAAQLYPESVQVLRVGEATIDYLAPILDDLAARASVTPDPVAFFRLQVLVTELLAAIAPHVRADAASVPGLRLANPHAGVWRWRVFCPVPHLVVETVAMMRTDLARHWYLADFAAHACLSASQYTRVFRHAYGLPPMTYLAMLRVREMARLLRETDLRVQAVCERVGWGSDGHAAAAFRHYYATTPRDYRKHGPPTTSAEGPGSAVTRHVAERQRGGNGCAPTC